MRKAIKKVGASGSYIAIVETTVLAAMLAIKIKVDASQSVRKIQTSVCVSPQPTPASFVLSDLLTGVKAEARIG